MIQGKYDLPIPFRVLIDPVQLLTAMKFEFASSNSIPVGDVSFSVTFTSTEIAKSSTTSTDEGPPDVKFGFTDLMLHGANWDFER